MGDTYTKLVYHIVFGTKGRAPLIQDAVRARLYPYIGGILREERGTLIQIGGMPDHVHVLAGFRSDMSVAAMVRLIKANSSRWMNQLPESQGRFEWQTGYGAFTVSESQLAVVQRYIETQEEHHARFSFKEELIALLQRHRIDFDERYIAV